jgi:hypothetical protein
MSTLIDTVRTQTVVVQDFHPESVSVEQTQRVVERVETGAVVVTGVLGPTNSTSISNSVDVDLSALEAGAVLVYVPSTNKWTATTLLDNQVIESGQY